MQQRKDEWLGEIDEAYHDRQFVQPYRSTIAFCDWLEQNGYISPDGSHAILDVGCGKGANTFYMARRYPKSQFVGMDINSDLIDQGNRLIERDRASNCRLISGDLFNFDVTQFSGFDGIVSLQTLSWLPDFAAPLESLIGLKPSWMAFSSLFYDGPLSCTIQVHDYDEQLTAVQSSFYNVYSLPVVRSFLQRRGYGAFESSPFEIDIDLPRPSHRGRGTYTEKLENGRRLQISGPLLMPWYFVACRTNTEK